MVCNATKSRMICSPSKDWDVGPEALTYAKKIKIFSGFSCFWFMGVVYCRVLGENMKYEV
jgi:hypothetical protein